MSKKEFSIDRMSDGDVVRGGESVLSIYGIEVFIDIDQ